MNKEAFAVFANRLKHHREKKLLSIDDVSETLRIRKDYIEAMEEGHFDRLPDGYGRIFYRSYFKFLGLDLDESMKEFDSFFKKKEDKTIKKPEFNPSLDLAKLKEKLQWVPVIIVILALIVLMLPDEDGDADKSGPIPEISIEDAKQTIDTLVTDVVLTDSVAINKNETLDSLRLRVELSGNVFFLLKIDSLYEKKVSGRSGKSYEFTGRSFFNLYVADGSKTQIYLNDTLIQRNTGDGERIHYMHINKKGILRKSISEIETKEETLDTIKKITVPNALH